MGTWHSDEKACTARLHVDMMTPYVKLMYSAGLQTRESIPASKQECTADVETAEVVPESKPAAATETSTSPTSELFNEVDMQVGQSMQAAGRLLSSSMPMCAEDAEGGETTQQSEEMSAAAAEAMKQRRFEKRQRQRAERRDHRTIERETRSVQRYMPPKTQSAHGRSADWQKN